MVEKIGGFNYLDGYDYALAMLGLAIQVFGDDKLYDDLQGNQGYILMENAIIALSHLDRETLTDQEFLTLQSAISLYREKTKSKTLIQ